MTENVDAKPRGLRRLARFHDEPVASAVARFQSELATATSTLETVRTGVNFLDEVDGVIPGEEEDRLHNASIEVKRLRDFQAEGVVPRRRDVIVLGRPLIRATIHTKA